MSVIPLVKTVSLRTEGLPPAVEYLAHSKHDDLGSDPENPHKKAETAGGPLEIISQPLRSIGKFQFK